MSQVRDMTDAYEETVVPRGAVELPAKLPVPDGFHPERLETWPTVPGRWEYVGGSLWFMPPTGEYQQDTAADVTGVLALWRRDHPDFVVGGNEAGMKLGGDVRAADAAVWRATDVGTERSHQVRRVPPILAVEITGRDETVEQLRDKATWYLSHGVEVVWIVDPPSRTVVVCTGAEEATYGLGSQIPEHGRLPDLTPPVDDLFAQIETR